MKVMILAAGKGVRLRPLTDRLPKPMVPIAGRPVIDHTLERVAALRPELVVINVHHLAELLIRHVGDGSAWGLQVVWSREERLLDTGGGVRRALSWLGEEPVLVINGDVLWEGDLAGLINAFDPRRMDAQLGLVANPPDHQGDFLPLWNSRLIRASGCGAMTFSGIQVLQPDRLASFPDMPFSLNRLYDDGISRGRLFGMPLPGRWSDIGTPERLDAARKLWGG